MRMVNRSPTAVRGGESSRRDGDFGQLMPDSQKKKASRGRKRAVGPRMGKPASTAERVSDLAWAGQHAQAIELATAALAAAGLSVGSRLDLLDLRAESYIAQGDLERAGADADAMLGLADHARTAAFKAQAQNRKALVQMRKVELKAAVGTVSAALMSERITVEPLGLVPFKGKAAAVDVFSVDSGQQR
jgi:hypothetical protein